MYNIIGIDIGTTEIKCTLSLANGLQLFWRAVTPRVNTNINDLEKITFSPAAIWEIVCKQIKEIYSKYPDEYMLVAIVSQAPSLCYWNDEGDSIGISYLSYYGDSKKNSKNDRLSKAIKRIQLANNLFAPYGKGKVSGLTGYIVYQLSEQLTMDAVTAWELGIESDTDESIIKNAIGIHQFPDIVAPVNKYLIKSKLFKDGIVIAGTTDSAILPISISPEFSDYYVYLGTWGSLLKSQISECSDYYKSHHKGNLHSWLISIPDFIYKVDSDRIVLEEMFEQIAKEVDAYSKIAVCGGLVFKMKDLICQLINDYLPTQNVAIMTLENTIVGSCRLGVIALEEKSK